MGDNDTILPPQYDPQTGEKLTQDITGPRTGYYCPGCGRTSTYQRECNGINRAQPHPPIEMVEASELDGDPSKFTPAPNTGK